MANQDMIGILQYSQKCESPIESILFWALARRFRMDADCDESCLWINIEQCDITPSTHGNKHREAWREWFNSHILMPELFYAQKTIRINNHIYRPDFSILCTRPPNPRPSAWVHIEADGHDYHEKTKDQAQRDKSRDRILMSQPDSKVLHYTGSEIYRDVDAIVSEILSHVYILKG